MEKDLTEKNDLQEYGDCWGNQVEERIDEARRRVAVHGDEETIAFNYDGVHFMAIVKPYKAKSVDIFNDDTPAGERENNEPQNVCTSCEG